MNLSSRTEGDDFQQASWSGVQLQLLVCAWLSMQSLPAKT